MKILHLPNERTNERSKAELTSRTAFENLLISGEITSYEVYSFLYETKIKGIKIVETEILKIAEKQQPDIIFWQHISEFYPTDNFYSLLKKIAPNTLLVYHDEDPFGKWIKPISKEMKKIITMADLSLTSGSGEFIDLFKKKGAINAYYFPHCFDAERTPHLWNPLVKREIPVVMIGSIFHSKIPGRYLPGALRRKEMAIAMTSRFKKEFYLYGNGWTRFNLESDRGLLPYEQQFSTLKNSWLSVNWDHFDTEPCYSSDRLPISMASGTPHITNWHPGYDMMFKECTGGIYFAKTPRETVEIATYLLSQPKEYLIEEGKKAFDFIFKYYESTIVYRKLIQFLKNRLNTK